MNRPPDTGSSNATDAKILKVERVGNQVKIQVEIDLRGSMLDEEKAILQAVNAVRGAAMAEALKGSDADGDPLPRKLAPDPVLALKDRVRVARKEAGKMREAALKALRDYGAKGE
jgi:hypothetical protein